MSFSPIYLISFPPSKDGKNISFCGKKSLNWEEKENFGKKIKAPESH
jgi:hypothetical protein